MPFKYKFVTFTGEPGTGKSKTVARLLKTYPEHLKMFTSDTSREARLTDFPGEYRRVSKEEMQANKESYLWIEEFGGELYGSACDSFGLAMGRSETSLSILVPKCIKLLRDEVASWDAGVLSFWFLSPDNREELVRRCVKLRGDSAAKVRARLEKTKGWRDQLTEYGLSREVEYIDGDFSLEQCYAEVEATLQNFGVIP